MCVHFKTNVGTMMGLTKSCWQSLFAAAPTVVLVVHVTILILTLILKRIRFYTYGGHITTTATTAVHPRWNLPRILVVAPRYNLLRILVVASGHAVIAQASRNLTSGPRQLVTNLKCRLSSVWE